MVKFPTQREGESVQLVLLKHWIVKMKVVIEALLLFVTPIIIVIVYAITHAPFFTTNYQKLFLAFFLLYLLFIALINFIHWLNEELDVFMISSERIISIDQVKFMHRTISETPLYQVQDARANTRGIFGTVLNFGDIEIQTAADKIFFRIQSVPNAFEVVGQILDLRNRYAKSAKDKHNGETAAIMANATAPTPPAPHEHITETKDTDSFNIVTGNEVYKEQRVDTDVNTEQQTVQQNGETFQVPHAEPPAPNNPPGPNPIDLSNK